MVSLGRLLKLVGQPFDQVEGLLERGLSLGSILSLVQGLAEIVKDASLTTGPSAARERLNWPRCGTVVWASSRVRAVCSSLSTSRRAR